MPSRRFRLTNMAFDFVSLVAAGDDPMAQVVIAKSAPADKNVGGANPSSTIPSNDLLEDIMGEPITKNDLAPEVVAYIEGLETEVDTLSAQVAKSETDLGIKDATIEDLNDILSKSVPKDAEAEGEISKSLLAKADPAIRTLIEKQQREVAEATAIAKSERDARVEREFISKVETMPMLSEDKVTLAGVLRRASEALSKEDNEVLDTVLKSANESIAQGNLFASFGNGGADTTVSKSVQAAADEIRKVEPTLTNDQALAKAYETNPALLEQAMTGQDN